MTIQEQGAVLVTGAEGFLGRAVMNFLGGSRQRVIALDSLAESFRPQNESTIKVVCDIRNQTDLESVFEEKKIDAIIHLAAILPTAAQRDPLLATQVNVGGSLNLLELARRFGVCRFVFGSSLSIYGSCSADRVAPEADPAAPEDVYGAAKLYIEQLGRAYAAFSPMQFVSLRIGRVVGKGAQSTTSAWRSEMFELLRADRPANIALPYAGSERVLLVYVEDAARALVTLLQNPPPAHGIYNAPCESWTVNELKQKLELLNPNIRIAVGDSYAKGNPRLLDSARFQKEFGLATVPLADRLRTAAGNKS